MLFLLQQLSSEQQPLALWFCQQCHFLQYQLSCFKKLFITSNKFDATLKNQLLFTSSFISINISRTFNVLYPVWLVGFVHFRFLGFQTSSGFSASSLHRFTTAFIATSFLNANKFFCDFSCTPLLLGYSSKLNKNQLWPNVNIRL